MGENTDEDHADINDTSIAHDARCDFIRDILK